MLADFLYETGHKAIYIGKGTTESKDDGISLGKVIENLAAQAPGFSPGDKPPSFWH